MNLWLHRQVEILTNGATLAELTPLGEGGGGGFPPWGFDSGTNPVLSDSEASGHREAAIDSS